MSRPLLRIFFFALIAIATPHQGFATDPFWGEYNIEFSNLTKAQREIIENTIHQLKVLEITDQVIPKGIYKRLTKFQELFGFPISGDKLAHWLLTKIRKVSYQNSWTAAINQNRGHFMLGDAFFTDLNSLERLYLLIHEGRHSDDNGYPHIKCPKNFKYVSASQPNKNLEKVLACDNSNKGAYAFQAAFLFELYAFGIFDQREVGLLYNSSVLRINP